MVRSTTATRSLSVVDCAQIANRLTESYDLRFLLQLPIQTGASTSEQVDRARELAEKVRNSGPGAVSRAPR